MKPPVEHVRVSAKGKDILLKIKRHTGLEHWNEICRVALCRSLADPTPPSNIKKIGDRNIEMEWKTFAGAYQEEYTALIILRAKKDNVDINKKDALAEYLRAHLERGIAQLQNIKNLYTICQI